MTSGVKAAAIYTRISSDQDGTGLGVARQEQDCRALAERLGWAVAEVYRDNDVSAYTGKKRPAYARMLEDLRAGRRDAVLIYHLDRLTRRPIELEEFVAATTAGGVKHVKFVTGDADIMTGDGLLVLRLMAAVAANESASKSRRMKRKYQEIAEKGLPAMGGTNRPFGYKPDRVTVDEAEAALIRDMVARYLAGESWRSLTTWIQEQQILSPAGKPWASAALRNMLTSARIAGLRVHNDQIVGPGAWPAIITVEQRQAMLDLVASRKNTGKRTPRRYVLSGMLRCHKCGGKLFSAARADYRRYVCLSGPDHRGCGGTIIAAEPVEELICRGVLARLASPDLFNAIAGRADPDSETAELAESAALDQAQLEGLASDYANRLISASEWRTARDIVDTRLRETRRQLANRANVDALANLDLEAGGLEEQFGRLELERQAAIVAAVLDHAVIHPGRSGIQVLDPSRVEPIWRI
jgi:site-specific DNA recombinase